MKLFAKSVFKIFLCLKYDLLIVFDDFKKIRIIFLNFQALLYQKEAKIIILLSTYSLSFIHISTKFRILSIFLAPYRLY